MIQNFLAKIIAIFGQNFYKLPYSLRVVWQIVLITLILLLFCSILAIIYGFIPVFKLKLISFKNKIIRFIEKIDFKRFIKRSKSIYIQNIANLSNQKKLKIGGLNVLIQTNWQFRRKKDKQYIIREPEELGFREVLDSNSLVNLAMANWIEIKEIVLDNGDDEGYFVSIILRNLTGKKISCKIPKGQIFENENIYEKTQNLAAREEYLYNFSENFGYRRLKIPAYCLNSAMLPPNGKAGKITIFEVMFKDFYNQDQLWRLIDRQNMLINPDGFSSNSKPDLLKSLIHASAQLQGLGKTMKQDEDSRNGFIAAVLNNKGHKAKDQARWGVSEKGGRAGEIDIKIDDENNDTVALCEAFNLEYKNTNVIKSHLSKIFKYDVNGTSRNFVLVYVESDDFIGLWDKYLDTANNIEYDYPTNQPIIDVSQKHCQYSDIKIAYGQHERNNLLSDLYHIFINMKPVMG